MPTSRETTVITPQLLADWALPEPREGKRSRGTVLVIGGSRATPGAVLLAGTAALRAGAGRLQLGVTDGTAAALSIAVPEAKVIGLEETSSGSISGDLPAELLAMVSEADVVVIGPGLNDVDEAETLMGKVLTKLSDEALLVVDAYALGALSHAPDLVAGCAERTVLTPNLSEAAHLLGRELSDNLDAESVAAAKKYGTVVSLFGHVATPDGRSWREESADAGLGTSGSGDVGAGLLAGLLGRGAAPDQAACWAAHVHAMAGRRLGGSIGGVGYLARELVDEIPATIATID